MGIYIGLMSGTSMDGIDVAVVEMPSSHLIFGMTKQYTAETKNRLELLVKEQDLTLASLCQLNTLIGREFAIAVNEALEQSSIRAQDVSAIGSHGQTVCHNISVNIPYTLQLGCAHTISSMTGITVIADFRSRDVVNGGQGAPFAPLYHQQLFGSMDACAVVNIGGIANISFIHSEQLISGWDVGPGNCLMDSWISLHSDRLYDADGLWASQGIVIPDLMESLLSDSYFYVSPPKSIGKEYFSLSWLQGHLSRCYKPVDVMSTLSALTAHCISNSIYVHSKTIRQMILCGGGTHNIHLVNTLKQLLPDVAIRSSAEIGINPDFLEAMMFAWFAYLAQNNISVDLSSITGSHGKQILGAIYPSNLSKSIL